MGKRPDQKKYIMKDKVYEEIHKDLSLRKKISERTGTTINNIRMLSESKSYKLTEYDTAVIISKHLDQPIEELFDIDDSKRF